MLIWIRLSSMYSLCARVRALTLCLLSSPIKFHVKSERRRMFFVRFFFSAFSLMWSWLVDELSKSSPIWRSQSHTLASTNTQYTHTHSRILDAHWEMILLSGFFSSCFPLFFLFRCLSFCMCSCSFLVPLTRNRL